MTFYVVAETLDSAVSAMEYLTKFTSITDATRERDRDGRLTLKIFAVSISEEAA